MLRQIASKLIPTGVVEAPKRPLQTPQREWLRGPLAEWADDCIETGLAKFSGVWLEPVTVRAFWQAYRSGQGDNSFFIWQWISLGLLAEKMKTGKGDQR
jgi:asparagine synthase (glutamine-hydrolysing)